MDKETARRTIRLIVANQRLQPNYIKQGLSTVIGKAQRLAEREEGRKGWRNERKRGRKKNKRDK